MASQINTLCNQFNEAVGHHSDPDLAQSTKNHFFRTQLIEKTRAIGRLLVQMRPDDEETRRINEIFTTIFRNLPPRQEGDLTLAQVRTEADMNRVRPNSVREIHEMVERYRIFAVEEAEIRDLQGWTGRSEGPLFFQSGGVVIEGKENLKIDRSLSVMIATISFILVGLSYLLRPRET